MTVTVGSDREPHHQERPHEGGRGSERPAVPGAGGGEQATRVTAGAPHPQGQAHVSPEILIFFFT